MLFRPELAMWAHPLLKPGISLEQFSEMIGTPTEFAKGQATLACFRIAKSLKKSPQDVAKEWAARLANSRHPLIKKIEVENAYINFYFDGPVYTRQVLDVMAKHKHFGQEWASLEYKDKSLVIDFSSPNMAKPIGIHHIRSTSIGHALANVFEFAGAKVHRLNYIGDYGTTFGQICYAFKHWGSKDGLERHGIRHLLEVYVRFNTEMDADKSLKEKGKEWFTRIEQKDPEAVSLWNLFREVSLKEFQKLYDRMGVRFTDWSGEAYYSDKMDAALEHVTKFVKLESSEGAQVFFLSPQDPPMIVKKSDGATTYATRDIAAAFDRQKRFKADSLLYVVANQQALHFKQLFEVLRKTDFPKSTELEHVKFGMLSFKDGTVTMSTRKGRIIFLDEVLDQATEKARAIISAKNPNCPDPDAVAEAVGIGAVIFNDLKSHRERDVRFSWDEALSFDGDSGPYIQYTHARTCAMFEKLGQPTGKKLSAECSFNDQSNQLAWRISLFPFVVQKMCKDKDLSHGAQYLLTLCGDFNNFYNHTIIRDMQGEVREGHLQLVKATGRVLKTGLEILGLRAPERI